MAFKGLFIGIDRYASAEINWLSCAGRDATALHALFSDTLGGETRLLTDGEATVAAIREAFEQLMRTDPDDVVVIAFSGTAPRPMNSWPMIQIHTIFRRRQSRSRRWANGVRASGRAGS